MERWFNQFVDDCPHFITAAVHHRQPLLLHHIDVVYRQLRQAADTHGCLVLAYVIMPDHLHAIVYAKHPNSVKSFTRRWLRQTGREVKPQEKFWGEAPKVSAVRSAKALESRMSYIHQNPVTRRLVSKAQDWPHSSFRQLVLGDEDVDFQCDSVLDQPWSFGGKTT